MSAPRQSVPGFHPWEQGGGGGFKPGDRVRVVGKTRGVHVDPSGDGTVEDAYDRASDAWSPYCPAVRVRFDGANTAREVFIGYDGTVTKIAPVA